MFDHFISLAKGADSIVGTPGGAVPHLDDADTEAPPAPKPAKKRKKSVAADDALDVFDDKLDPLVSRPYESLAWCIDRFEIRLEPSYD